jgi:phage shock protein PspC (stress-responsive transcriptional regulator)
MTSADDAAAPAATAAGRLPSLPRVHRSERGRVVAGVCAGIAESLRVDVSVVRLVFVVLAFASGSGIVLYLGAWLVLPPPDRRGGRRSGAARAWASRSSSRQASSRCAVSASRIRCSGRAR